MNILLITPIKKEYHAAREVFGAKEISFDLPGRARTSVLISGKDSLRILFTGAGRENILKGLEFYGSTSLDLVIDSGSCGSLRKNITMGCIVNCVVALNEEGCSLTSLVRSRLKKYPETIILEVTEPVVSQEAHTNVREQFQADVCSMETYTIAEWARLHGVDCLSLRVVTDHADDQTPKDFKKYIRKYSLELYREIKKTLHLGFQK